MKFIETERLLRPWRMEDSNDFYEYVSNENIAQYATFRYEKPTRG
ncbi:MAG TPA: N-acetyltransferase, partial [Clostridiales bacterium]|nr:N-acetyltransferase [Clostridiales bacterium]